MGEPGDTGFAADIVPRGLFDAPAYRHWLRGIVLPAADVEGHEVVLRLGGAQLAGALDQSLQRPMPAWSLMGMVRRRYGFLAERDRTIRIPLDRG